MQGYTRCIDGRLMRHDPQPDDPYLETDRGPCPGCDECEPTDDDFKCPTCKGTGTVNPLTAPKGFFCVSSTDCPHCDGLGEI